MLRISDLGAKPTVSKQLGQLFYTEVCLEHGCSRGVHLIYLTAIIKKPWVVAFCRELLDRGLDVVWQFPSGTRCEVIDDEVADLLNRSGGRHLAYAPESGSEETRKLIKNRIKTDSLLEAIRASVRNQLNITAFFVIGFPHDTKEHLRDTVRLARKLAIMGVDDIAIGFFFPIPNTQRYRELVAKGRVDYSDECLMAPIFANDEKLRPANNFCENLSARQLTWMKYRILLNFYPVSFLSHPTHIFTIIANVFRGRETRKLEHDRGLQTQRLKGPGPFSALSKMARRRFCFAYLGLPLDLRRPLSKNLRLAIGGSLSS